MLITRGRLIDQPKISDIFCIAKDGLLKPGRKTLPDLAEEGGLKAKNLPRPGGDSERKYLATMAACKKFLRFRPKRIYKLN